MTETEVETAVDEILAMAPRIVTVARRTIWSFGLHAGVNAVMLDTPKNTNVVRHIMEGYRSDATMMTVIRLCALLDSGKGKDVVSFQAVFHRLKAPDVAEALVARNLLNPDPFYPDRQEKLARDAIADLRRAYQEIDWETFGRLKHFRNHGVAHLLGAKPSKSITYDKLEEIVRLVARMSEAISHFLPDIISPCEGDIDETKNNARKIWKVAYRGSVAPKKSS